MDKQATDEYIDKYHVWHPFDAIQLERNEYITHAKGAYLYTNEGRTIIDAISSWWVNLHGHCNEHISNAVKKQIDQLEHVIFAGFTHKPAIELTRRLLPLLPGNMEHLFFSDNGSTSTEVALKMAFQYWFNKGEKNRTTVIALEGAYHGDTFGAMSVGGRSLFSKPFEPMLFDVKFLPFPTEDNEEEVLKTLQKYVSGGNTAAFIYEPLVQGAAGMRMYPATILDKILSVAKKNKVICIADEVMTGFGRTGKLFASEYMQHKPDIICLSKGLTGGYLPLGVTACTTTIHSAFDKTDHAKVFYHGHSYTANPLACAAAVASLELTTDKITLKRIAELQEGHQQFINRIKNHPKIGNVQCMGTILRIELKNNQTTNYTNPLREITYFHFLKSGILLRPLGNVVYLLPPYIIEKEDVTKIYNCIEDFLHLLDTKIQS